ncbi:hypothetical protein ACNFBR_19000 [Pseudomonas sp. NY11955]|uniref:hypothetical protein n=1 Tax=Pseudomonas sp. NY11955 TaxID=3400363 RepID=UPI003A842DFD
MIKSLKALILKGYSIAQTLCPQLGKQIWWAKPLARCWVLNEAVLCHDGPQRDPKSRTWLKIAGAAAQPIATQGRSYTEAA